MINLIQSLIMVKHNECSANATFQHYPLLAHSLTREEIIKPSFTGHFPFTQVIVHVTALIFHYVTLMESQRKGHLILTNTKVGF